MDKFREFQESFISHFKFLCVSLKNKSGKELDDSLIRHAMSDEQKVIIQETCKDIDEEHDMIEEMNHSNKTPGQFLKQDITDTLREINPNATDEDVNQLVEATMDGMEKAIEQEAHELTKEVSLPAEEAQTK